MGVGFIYSPWLSYESRQRGTTVNESSTRRTNLKEKGEKKMKKLLTATKNFDKKDLINSRNGLSLQDEENGFVIEVTKAATMEDTDEETGEIKKISVLIDPEGKTYTSISATVDDIMDDVIELLDEGEPISLRLLKRKSNGGREFLSFQVM